jgi:hypothetical protein
MKRSGIQDAAAKNLGLHPGYKRDNIHYNHCDRLLVVRQCGFEGYCHSEP